MSEIFKNVAVVILAAGMGKRMRSKKAKVLHEILGKPMVLYVVETAKKIVGSNIVVVVGHQGEKVQAVVAQKADARFAYQAKQLGTGHAVLCALPHIPATCENVIILCGDVPLIRPQTLRAFIKDHLKAERDVSLLAVEMENPKGYGRVLLDKDSRLYGIVEEADANANQKRLKFINTGIYCVKRDFLSKALPQLRSENAQGEFYLTDIIGIGYSAKLNLGINVGGDDLEVLGVNTLHDLKNIEKIVKTQGRNRS